jgi:hypothetical protein
MLSKVQQEKIRSIKQGYEHKGMKEVKARDGVWRPKNIGEVLEGEYLEREEDADSYHRNKYHFTDNGMLKDSNGRPVGIDGRVAVFGSITLDERMSKIPIGANVAIIFCGEKVNPGFKNPTKLFTVMSNQEIEITPEEESITEEDKNAQIIGVDDPQARELIKDCITYLKDEGNHNPTEEEIAEYAKKLIYDSDEPNRELLTNVQLILAEKVKKKKAEEEGGK